MDKRVKLNMCYFLFLLLSSINVSLTLTTSNSLAKSNPFTPKSAITRYWKTQILNKKPIPSFLISKASPLAPFEFTLYTKLASNHSLSSHLSSFCSLADLCCFLDSEASNTDHAKDSNFAIYDTKKFSNYGTSRLGGSDTFKNYSENTNFASSGFTKYSGGSTGHLEGFTSYATDGNVANSNFTSYASDATGGTGDFSSYMPRVNVPDLRFATYSANGNNHPMTFKSYVDDTNSGNEQFSNYAKAGNGVPVGFTSYGDTSNVIGSGFSHYGELANGANDSFKAYSSNGNNPKNDFKAYGGSGGNAGSDNFVSYRDGANSGSDTFWSYGRKSNSGKTNFVNYGKSFNPGSDFFKEYGETKQCVGSIEDMIDFAVSVLGRDVVARTTENVSGSKKEVMIGDVKGVNGGKLTKSVSCHQSLYPYLLYYCHSVPKVRVYVADILDVESKAKINSGVAICHIDTSSWSPGHGAFVALGPGPGKIEVCHWIFENDLTWTTAD
nr:hypothetical protein [Tanacetum cinerariifolium]